MNYKQMFKPVSSLFILIIFTACDNSQRITYQPKTLEEKQSTHLQEETNQTITPIISTDVALNQSSFADDIIYFQIRGEHEEEPQVEPTPTEEPQQTTQKKATSYGGEDSESDGGSGYGDDEEEEDTQEEEEEEEEIEEKEEDSPHDNDQAVNVYATTKANDNYKKLGYMNVTLQYKSYYFTIARHNYGNKSMEPQLNLLSNGNYHLFVTGYLIKDDEIDWDYGTFSLEIENIDLKKVSGYYPIKSNILTNSSTDPLTTNAWVSVTKDGENIQLTATVGTFLLYNRTKTKIYEAYFNISINTEE